jgi:hypothetical protein
MAADFSDDLIQHHAALLAHSMESKEAVIRKMVALLALAFEIHPRMTSRWISQRR